MSVGRWSTVDMNALLMDDRCCTLIVDDGWAASCDGGVLCRKRDEIEERIRPV